MRARITREEARDMAEDPNGTLHQDVSDCGTMLDHLERGHGGSVREHAQMLGWGEDRTRAALDQLKRDRVGLRHNGVLGIWWLPRDAR
jgi:hypothetical protein